MFSVSRVDFNNTVFNCYEPKELLKYPEIIKYLDSIIDDEKSYEVGLAKRRNLSSDDLYNIIELVLISDGDAKEIRNMSQYFDDLIHNYTNKYIYFQDFRYLYKGNNNDI